MDKKRSFGLTLFGWLFIVIGSLSSTALPIMFLLRWKAIFSVFSLIMVFDPFFSQKNLPFIIGFITFFAFATIIFFGLLHIIFGIGILRLRPWARYLTISLMLSLLIYTPFEFLMFGYKFPLALRFLLNAFILWFFMRHKIKKQFGIEKVPFTIKSRYGIVVCLITFFVFIWPISFFTYKAYSSLKYNKPFFNIKPQRITLKPIDDRDFKEKFRRIELFDISMLIPKDFYIVGFYMFTGEFTGALKAPAVNMPWLIMLHAYDIFAYEDMYESMPKILNFKSTYEFERAFLTNNWNPIIMYYRKFLGSDGMYIKINKEFDSKN